MIIESNSLCVHFHFSCVHFWKKKSLIFYTEELIFVPARRSFHLNDRNEDAATLYKQKAGKTRPLIGLKQFVLPRQTVDKQLLQTTSFPGSRGCFQKNFKHQPVGDILFFFSEPLLAQSSKHLTFFRQGMYWDRIKMERPIIMKCCTIIC